MPSYSELVNQAQALMAKAEEVRQQEIASVIADIKAKMKEFGISLSDLGGGSRKSGGKSKSAAKYRGPNGETWSGGPGRRPGWVRELTAAGKSIEDYRI